MREPRISRPFPQRTAPVLCAEFLRGQAGKRLIAYADSPQAPGRLAGFGGMDSLVLFGVCGLRQRIVPFPTELFVCISIPIRSVITPRCRLCSRRASERTSRSRTTASGPHSPENRKNSPCIYCAWLRASAFRTVPPLPADPSGLRPYRGLPGIDLFMTSSGRPRDGCRQGILFHGTPDCHPSLLHVDKRQISRACRDWSSRVGQPRPTRNAPDAWKSPPAGIPFRHGQKDPHNVLTTCAVGNLKGLGRR
jgi:hypothetical protein